MLKKILVAITTTVMCSYSSAINLDGTVFAQVGAEKNIDPVLLYAVALTESAYVPDPSVAGESPYPWTLRTPKKAIYLPSEDVAKRQLEKLLSYTQSIDIGLMQINLRWHKSRVKNPEDLLDPLTNVRVGADILLENFSRYPNDLIEAIGRYHSSDLTKKQVYGLTVYNIYTGIKNNAR